MYAIPKITKEIKSSVYETIIYTSKLLCNNIEFENAEKFNPKDVEDYFVNINAFDPNLYTDEKLLILKEQYVPGLRNVFSVDLAVEKIRYDVQELTTKLISKLRYTVSLLDNDYKGLISKKKQINTLIDKTKKDILPLVDANRYFNINFEEKTKLLESCQKFLATAYAGKLFLSHSVEDLLTIVWNITNNLFVLEESKTGRTLADKFDLNGSATAVKYFVSKQEIKKFKGEDIIKFSVPEFLKEFGELPKQLKSDSDSIIDFIISLHEPKPNKQPDSPQTTATVFDETVKSVMMAWSRASGIFDADLRMMIEETSTFNIEPILDIVTEIEECYRKLSNKDELGADDFTKEMTDLSNFIKLLNAGVTCTYFDLECRVYDILRYLINFDFFLFIKNLVNTLYLTYRNENKDSQPGGNVTNADNQTVKPEGTDPQDAQNANGDQSSSWEAQASASNQGQEGQGQEVENAQDQNNGNQQQG